MHPDAAPTFVTLPYERTHDLPARFDGEGYVRTPPASVEHFLDRFTDPGDVVLDPFAGFGTTLAVAERLDRRAYGVEYEADRAAYVRERVAHPDRVHHGSAFDLPDLPDAPFDLPSVDCCLTSPPYSTEAVDGDPFRNYDDDTDRPHEDYLAALADLFADLEPLFADGAHVLLDVANLKHDAGVSTLAWDVAAAVRERTPYEFAGEVVVGWEAVEANDREGRYGYGYDHSYYLVFRARPRGTENGFSDGRT